MSFNDEDPRDYDRTLDVHLTTEESAALSRIPWYDEDIRRTIMAALAEPGRVILWGTVGELDDLLDVVAGEANHESQRKWRKRLDSAFDKIEVALKGAG